MEFRLHAPYEPTGDQPQAIDALVQGLDLGLSEQVLLGVTGSGKTFTMANVIARVNRPTLVLAHNKTLAAQLCSEFREFFPENAVEYFISYYDYYQPEAYIAHTDTYIEKDSSVNEEIDRLRHSATSALFERRDVIVVASVSCIYGLGDPIDYQNMVISLRIGQSRPMDEILRKLTEIRYERNDINFTRNTFRVRGDTLEIYPAYWAGRAIRVEFFGDEVDRISEINAVTGLPERILDHVAIYPASHYVTTREKMERAIREIEREMDERVKYFEERGKLLEAQRIAQRTRYDIEMMQEIGFCTGIENYSRVISGRAPGTPPMTLIDYFPDDFLLMVDESHVTLPQVRAMYNGDRSRKESLVQYGFRLPSAFDNRPLTFDEFESKLGQRIYISATPAPFERERAGQIAEQVIRPTGLLDPEVIVRPIDGQIDDLITEIHGVISRGERVLVTTLTKKMAEDLTDYLGKAGIRVRSSATCAWQNSTCWWASTCCARVWTCRRWPSWPSSTRTRRASCARRPPSSRPSAAPPATPEAGSSCTPIISRPPCAPPSTRPTAAGPSKAPTTRPTASCRRPSSRTCASSSRSAATLPRSCAKAA